MEHKNTPGTPATNTAAHAFITRWKGVTASELSTSQSFVIQLCELLGVAPPHPTAEQDYMFERPITFRHGDGSSIDRPRTSELRTGESDEKKIKDMLNNARNSDAYWLGRARLHVATQLQDMLKASGINQAQFAEALGVKAPMVSRLINGQGNPTLETLVKAGRVLGYVPRVTFVPVEADPQNDADDAELLAAFDKGMLTSVAAEPEVAKFTAAARATALKDLGGRPKTLAAIRAARAGNTSKTVLNKL